MDMIDEKDKTEMALRWKRNESKKWKEVIHL